MSGTSSNESKTSQTSQTTPYAPAVGAINNALGVLGNVNPSVTPAESGAAANLESIYGAGNPYAPAIGGAASQMLTGGMNYAPMVTGAAGTAANNLAPMASGALNDPSTNPQFQNYLAQTTNDVSNSLGSMYAAAGRDPSGAGNFAQNVGRGVGQATAPAALSFMQNATGNQLAANNAITGNANSAAGVLGNLQAQQFGNMTNGINAAGAANNASTWGPSGVLSTEQLLQGLPLSMVQQILGAVGPTAGAFGTSTGSGTQSGTQTMSPWQMMTSGISALGQANPFTFTKAV